MKYSWQFFITSKVPKLLRQYHNLHFNIEIMFVDPSHLHRIGLGDSDWRDFSERRIQDAKVFCNQAEEYHGRLSVIVKTYENLPPWHGYLLNNEHLFLGRANWIFKYDEPKLTVGQNVYRYFNTSSGEGSERIELFANWHRFYLEHASTLVCSTRRKTSDSVEE